MAALFVVAVAAVIFVIAREPGARGSAGDDEASLGLEPGDPTPDSSATIRSLQQYWTAELPETYQQRFVDLRGGYQPKTPASPPFSCGGQPQTYEAIQGNAFYCGGPNDDYIAWDASALFPRLNETFGSIAPAVVLSHEMGHAIQARADVDASSIVTELQADCFAGAWTAFAQQSEDDPVELEENALDGAIAAVLTLRDQPGTAAINPQAHGSGFDRVNAFQTGFEQGASRCAQFEAQGVQTTELPFRTREDAATGGNLPYQRAVPLLVATLDEFWAGSISALDDGAQFQPPRQAPVATPPLAPCPDEGVSDEQGASYCPSSNTVSWADSVLAPIQDRVGDLAPGTILADQWGRAGQAQAGLPIDGRDAGLQRDCMTGAWISSIGSAGLSGALLSPGDVDEALATIIGSTFAVQGAREDRGDAFTRTRAFRAGVEGGAGPCRTIAESL